MDIVAVRGHLQTALGGNSRDACPATAVRGRLLNGRLLAVKGCEVVLARRRVWSRARRLAGRTFGDVDLLEVRHRGVDVRLHQGRLCRARIWSDKDELLNLALVIQCHDLD
jgi:hypothetical protein